MSQQQSLFDTEPAPWELDDAAQQHVATVVLASGPGGEFDYLVPEGVQLEVGCRVKVPLGRGNRSVVGYCVEVGFKSAGGRKLKAIAEVLDAAGAAVAVDAAADAVDGRLLSLSLGPGAGGRGAGGRAAEGGDARCDAAVGAAGGRGAARRTEALRRSRRR